MYEKITLHDKTFVPYISNEVLEKAIDKVAEKINADYSRSSKTPVFLCVLNGAMMFAGDILKRCNFTAELMSIKMTSYVGTESTGKIKVPMGLTGSVEGKDVIVIEDIVDTGNTIVALRDILLEKGASAVKICTMLTKPEVYKQSLPLDYVGMEIENRFIVGYGLDYDELGRNLKDIYILEK